jgi:WD40 repeat protein
MRDGSVNFLQCEDDDYYGDDNFGDGDGDGQAGEERLGSVRDAKFSPDGKHLVASTGRMLRLWSVRTSKLVKEWHANQELVVCVAFMPNGRGLVTAGSDHTLKYWDLGNPRAEFSEFFGHYVCLFYIFAYTASDVIFNFLIGRYFLYRCFTGWSMDLLWFK